MIPYGHQYIDADDIKAVTDVLTSDWLTQGPHVDQLEKDLATYCGAKEAVVVSNGTAALHLAYMAAGIEPGDEVIVPANTFAATTNMLLAIGAIPVFCDARTDTYNIDESKIEALVTGKTRAIVPVHFAGQACDMKAIRAIADRHTLLVIEDAAHALGAEYTEGKIGNCELSDLATFSFHPVKSITTGEGGAIMTNDPAQAKKMRTLRKHGMVGAPEEVEYEYEGPWYNEISQWSWNYRISDLQCALGSSQLKKLDGFLAQRREMAQYYHEQLASIDGVATPDKGNTDQSSWHLYVILVDKERRKQIFERLRERGIWTQVHYIPVYHHPWYRKNGYADTSLENTEDYYARCMSLPIYPGLTREDQDTVISTLKEILSSM